MMDMKQSWPPRQQWEYGTHRRESELDHNFPSQVTCHTSSSVIKKPDMRAHSISFMHILYISRASFVEFLWQIQSLIQVLLSAWSTELKNLYNEQGMNSISSIWVLKVKIQVPGSLTWYIGSPHMAATGKNRNKMFGSFGPKVHDKAKGSCCKILILWRKKPHRMDLQMDIITKFQRSIIS